MRKYAGDPADLNNGRKKHQMEVNEHNTKQQTFTGLKEIVRNWRKIRKQL